MITVTSRPAVQTMRPMGWGASLCYFGGPALLYIGGFYGLMPLFIAWGLPVYFAYCLGLLLPSILLVVASFVAVRQEGWAWTWSALCLRFRLHPLTGKQWLGVLGVFILAMGLGSVVIGGIVQQLILYGWIPLPPGLPLVLNPVVSPTPSLLFASIGGAANALLFLGVFTILLVFNVVGEELWWRGYILPRQELAFGRRTWWVHGMLWCLFHAFKYWQYPALAIATLGIALLATRTKNTTASLAAHTCINAIALLPIVIGILMSR